MERKWWIQRKCHKWVEKEGKMRVFFRVRSVPHGHANLLGVNLLKQHIFRVHLQTI